MKKSDVQLGDVVKDTITGFQGVVTGRFEFLNGCVRVAIQPEKLDKDGCPIEAVSFDVEQVKLLKAAKHEVKTPAGGPMPDPKR